MAILNQIYWLALMGPYIRKIVKNKISLMLGIVFGQNVNENSIMEIHYKSNLHNIIIFYVF